MNIKFEICLYNLKSQFLLKFHFIIFDKINIIFVLYTFNYLI